MAQSPEQLAQAMIDNLPEKTGKPLEAWLTLLRASGLEKHGQIVKHLKADHGMTHGYANLVAQLHLRGDEIGANDTLVAAQYAGPKADLRPIYERVVEVVNGFGQDVELAPKKAYVSLRRSKQFGLIQPSTRTRVDLGLNLPDEPATDRLEPAGSFNAMVTHRVRLASVEEVDDELIGWLRAAFDRA